MLIGCSLVRNEADRWLKTVLEQMVKVCDKVVIVDDGSTDETPEICSQYGEVHRRYTSQWATNEVMRRKELWALATREAKDGDWVLCLDADETIPLIELLPEVLKQVETAECDGLGFRLYDMWNETHYRDDQWWRGHKGLWPMCVRYNANKEYIWNETPLHCGRFPKNAIDRLAQSEIAIQHWGWSKPEDRQVKYERYMKADPEGKWGFIGQYESILDPNPNLVEFKVEIK